MNLADFLNADIEPEVEEKIEVEKLSIFDILNALTKNKIQLDFDNEVVSKSYDQYMINKFISMEPRFLIVAEKLNSMTNLTDEHHFNTLFEMLPKEYVPFGKLYIKGKKDISEKEKRYIAHYYEIGLREANVYINQMSDDDIENVLRKYRYGKNEMIKV